MNRRRNWIAWTGLLLVLGGVVGYFALVLTSDPTLHRLLQTPVVSLVLIAAGLVLSATGVRHALRGTHSGRFAAPVIALVSVGLAGAFGWYLFVYSYRMPASAGAPQVGSIAPDFSLPDERANDVRLASLRGRPVVLVFYRGHW